jgi:hypothetical protein
MSAGMRWILFTALVLLANVCGAQTWLSLPANTGYFAIGDLDVPGTQLTVECLYTSTNPASVDLVSKHSGPGDVNYLLRRTHAELTTGTGFSSTPSTCPPDENTCRHAAMVYNGTTLSFYLNGQLNGQVARTGNMAQNNFQALVGNYGCCFAGEQFFGFIDEVRIWGVARTQADIQNFMFIPLPTPTTQFGLLAYYSFNSTINLQGNALFNGSIAGTASLGNANPTCFALTPLCVILGGKFDRFTVSSQGDGLQLDWEWNGVMPQHFRLETGPSPSELTAIQDIEATNNSLSLRHQPMQATWYRLSAITANGEVVSSNAVEFVPDHQMPALSAVQMNQSVQVTTTLPMPVLWRIHNLAGQELGRGERFSNGKFEIALPENVQGIVFVTVIGEGRQVVVKCQVTR